MLAGCAGDGPAPVDIQRSVGDERPDEQDHRDRDTEAHGDAPDEPSVEDRAPAVTTAVLPDAAPADGPTFDNGVLVLAVPAGYEPYHDHEWTEANGDQVFYGERIPGTTDPVRGGVDSLSFVAVYPAGGAHTPDDLALTSTALAGEYPAGDPRAIHTRYSWDVPGAEIAEAYLVSVTEGFHATLADVGSAWFPAKTRGWIHVSDSRRGTTLFIQVPPGDEGLALVASVARSIHLAAP